MTPISKIISVTLLLTASFTISNAASFSLINFQAGPGVDTLFANVNGTLMNNSGSVTIGYFPQSVATNNVNTISGLVSVLGSFTSLQTAVPGTSTDAPVPGYLAEGSFDLGKVTGLNSLSALVGRSVYVISTNASNLSAATVSNSFSLFLVGNITDETSFENAFTGNPAGKTPILGTRGSFIGDPGPGSLGAGTYDTIQLAAIPETSATLLGAVGAFVLLRRRRN